MSEKVFIKYYRTIYIYLYFLLLHSTSMNLYERLKSVMWATRVKSGIFNLTITRNPHLGNFHKLTYFSMLHEYCPLPGDAGV